MKYKIGYQYEKDDSFKAAARLHQSQYRARILKVDFDEYGNRLLDQDARKFLNYYEGLDVRSVYRKRYPSFSKRRDADMLRSEHIPFNFFAPLHNDFNLAKNTLNSAFGIKLDVVHEIKFEFAPEPKEEYLGDRTAFDIYIQYSNGPNDVLGVGVEVKYTEKDYKIGKIEKSNVENKKSKYWKITKASGAFLNEEHPVYGTDPMRQIWRNHLLGLAMMQKNEISEFTSIILYPKGNKHFNHVIPEYRELLRESCRSQIIGCTYEKFIDSIMGDNEVLKWKAYLVERYLVTQ